MTEGERVSPGRSPARRRHEVAPEAGAFFCPSPSGRGQGEGKHADAGGVCRIFAGRHNIREQDTADHMAFLAERMAGEEIIVSGVDSMIIFSFQKMT